MRNLLITLRFNGQEYHGWQVQPNGVTVQQCVQDAVEAVTGVRSAVTGCSRTDAGVHAMTYCCNFRTDGTHLIRHTPTRGAEGREIMPPHKILRLLV